MTPFIEKLSAAQQKNRSYLCIGLDIVVANNPAPISYYDEPMLPFARAIIEATSDLVCAYKPNLGFYLAEGAAGSSMTRTVPVARLTVQRGAPGAFSRAASASLRSRPRTRTRSQPLPRATSTIWLRSDPTSQSTIGTRDDSSVTSGRFADLRASGAPCGQPRRGSSFSSRTGVPACQAGSRQSIARARARSAVAVPAAARRAPH